jgi:predicted metal-dependent enzyme (double-stranded beta helix superfamily)
MATLDLQEFIDRLRDAASSDNAATRVEALMLEAFRDPAAVRAAMPAFDADEEILFEDESLSVYYCRFDPDQQVPPHDHGTTAIIGVYEGGEVNSFYRAGEGRLVETSSVVLEPGDVLRIGPDAIHTVMTSGAESCHGLHVYLAPLTTMDRSLYDWETGTAEPMTDKRFEALTRHRPDAT